MNQLENLNNFNRIVVEAFLNEGVTSEKFVGELEGSLSKRSPIETFRQLLVNSIDITYDNGIFKFVSNLKGKELSFKVLDILC